MSPKKKATRKKATRRGASRAADDHQATLRSIALGYPEAWEDHPWEENAYKVGKKVFLFLSRHEGGLNLSVKLPHSCREALLLPFATPTGYGLGKHGWVTARFEDERDPPIGILADWIDESYRAVAPKRLVKELPQRTFD